MTATTLDRNTVRQYIQRQIDLPLTASTDIPAGAMVMVISGTGTALNAADTAGGVMMGIATQAVSYSGGDRRCIVERGCYWMANDGNITAADIGKLAYVLDNQTVSNQATTLQDVVAGYIEAVDTTLGVLVSMANPHETVTGGDSGTVADATISPAVTVGGIQIEIPIAIPDHATQTLTYKTRDKIEIISVSVLKDGAGAANTIQLTDSADAAISDAIAAAVDKAVTSAGTLDVAKRIIAAGGTFKVVATRAAGTMAALVIVRALKRA